MKILYKTKPYKRTMTYYLYVDHDKRYIDYFEREADQIITTTKEDIKYIKEVLKDCYYTDDYPYPLF